MRLSDSALLGGLKEVGVEVCPGNQKSAGCIFKNPPGGSAGRMIDEIGFKGHRVGDARSATGRQIFSSMLLIPLAPTCSN